MPARFFVAVVFFILTSHTAFGFGIEDVVRLKQSGYDEQQILEIIATKPSFDVEPEEIARLKEVNVSENLIRSLIERVQVLLANKQAQTKSLQFKPKIIPGAGIGDPFWSIVSGSTELLEIGDDAGFLSTKTRAEVIARQLNKALMIGGGRFTVIPRNQFSAVVFQGISDQVVIVSVSNEDAAIHSRNSEAQTPEFVADQWSDTLNRFWMSLPTDLLLPAPRSITLNDMEMLAKSGLSDETILTFFFFRNIDHAIERDQIKGIGFSKDVIQYVQKQIGDTPRDRFWGSDDYGSSVSCRNTNVTISGSVGFGAGIGFRGRITHKTRSTGSTVHRSSRVKGSSAGQPGRSLGRSRNSRSNSTPSHSN
jgi:hypothetical protein